MLLAPVCARLNNFRDSYHLALLGNREVEHHVQHLVDHRVELILRNVDAIQAAGRWAYSSVRLDSRASEYGRI